MNRLFDSFEGQNELCRECVRKKEVNLLPPLSLSFILYPLSAEAEVDEEDDDDELLEDDDDDEEEDDWTFVAASFLE